MRRPSLALERAWSGAPGTIAWSRLLAPLALAYGTAAARARRRAERARVRIEGTAVVAFGGLTVGGSGKSSVSRWFARRLADTGAGRVAVLLRGYGAAGPRAGAELLPDYAGLDPAARAGRYGDDALAHRAALPRSVAVVTGVDRRVAAHAALEGFGAEILLLDDGWEQPAICWDRLVAVLDPLLPAGNGRLLPAGPLRRPVETLAEASWIAFVLEEEGGLPESTGAFLRRHAPSAPILLLRRRLVGLSPVGQRDRVPAPPGVRAGLISGVGAPDRLARFVSGAGISVAGHAAFPNHTAWRPEDLLPAAEGLRRAGAEMLLITEKDEARWPRGFRPGLPARVIRTELVAPVGAPCPEELVAAARGGRAAGGLSGDVSRVPAREGEAGSC